MMSDLISRAAAIEAFDDERVDRNYGDVSPESVIRIIESIPAVDAAPVVHGRWIERTYERDGITIISYFCSVCNGEHYYGRADFCPNCGARMDMEEED